MTDGLIKYPDSGDLYLARGVITEYQALPNTRDVVDAMLHFNLEPVDNPGAASRTMVPNPSRVSPALQSASNDYREAIGLNDSSPHARLRLGWVHYLQRDSRARGDLLPAVDNSADAELEYLGHLLLGAIAERGSGIASAIPEYEAARRTGSQFPTGCVALSHAYLVASRSVEADDREAHRLVRSDPVHGGGAGGASDVPPGIDVVEVDAQVARGNKPVTGLTARNFNVTDNGVRQEITGVNGTTSR